MAPGHMLPETVMNTALARVGVFPGHNVGQCPKQTIYLTIPKAVYSNFFKEATSLECFADIGILHTTLTLLMLGTEYSCFGSHYHSY